MDAETGWRWLEGRRRAFAEVLEGLSPAQWATPSLCDGWTVREVVAHMMVGPSTSMLTVAGAMLRARGRFHRANDMLARRAAARPTSDVIELFRRHAAHRFTPPGMDWRAPVTDFSVHRLDALVPLRLADDGPTDDEDAAAWPTCLAALRNPRIAPAFAAGGAPELTYAATDVDFRDGTGPRVEGPAAALALALTRRAARVGELSGPGAPALAAWASR